MVALLADLKLNTIFVVYNIFKNLQRGGIMFSRSN